MVIAKSAPENKTHNMYWTVQIKVLPDTCLEDQTKYNEREEKGQLVDFAALTDLQ